VAASGLGALPGGIVPARSFAITFSHAGACLLEFDTSSASIAKFAAAAF
jgi:hypothetical protein